MLQVYYYQKLIINKALVLILYSIGQVKKNYIYIIFLNLEYYDKIQLLIYSLGFQIIFIKNIFKEKIGFMNPHQPQFTNPPSKPLRSPILCSLQLITPHQDHLHPSSIHSKKDKPPQSTPSVNNFIQKTFMILQEQKFQSIVSWASSTGTPPQYMHTALKQLMPNIQNKALGTQTSTFKIHNVKAFEEVVLPQYFKHSNLSSFVRQLNMYNFHKIRGDKNEFQFEHDKFIKDRPDLLHEIKRKQVQSSSSIPSISLIPNQQLRQVQYPKTTQKYNNPDSFSRQYKNYQEKGKSQEKDNSSPIKREESYGSGNQAEDTFYRLAELQQTNRMLKKSKQAKLSVLKQMANASKMMMANKFNKIVMALLSVKCQCEKRQKGHHRGQSKKNMDSLSETIEHIMNNSAVKSFSQYLEQMSQFFTEFQNTEKTN